MSAGAKGPVGLIWWARPETIYFWLTIPVVLTSFALSDELASARGVHSYFSFELLAAIIGCIILMIFTSYVGRRARLPRAVAARRLPSAALDLLFWASVAAHLVWFGGLLANPSLLFAVAHGTQGAVYAVREQYATIPGVTTLTQCSVAYACVIAFQYPGLEGVKRRHLVFLALILVMAVFRMFAWSERLALIELAVPLALTFARYRPGKKMHWWFAVAPLLGYLAIFFLFASTEYLRSWINHYSAQSESLIQFSLIRISEYYFFAINNGIALFEYENSSFPHYSLGWLLKMPLFGDVLTGIIQESGRARYLSYAGDPELNNFGGLLGLLVDYGIVLGTMATGLFALIAGVSAKRFTYGRGFLGLIYPVLFSTLLELPRLFYIGEPRAVVPMLVLALMWLFMAKRSPLDLHAAK